MNRPAYRDRRGIPYDERRTLVTARVDTWPKYPRRVTKDTDGLQAAFHGEFRGKPCWLCGERGTMGCKMELHHLAAGSRGRSHERELFTLLCHGCHDNVSPDDLGKLLWSKWFHDREYCDWELLTIRHSRHLPELEIPDWCKTV